MIGCWSVNVWVIWIVMGGEVWSDKVSVWMEVEMDGGII